MPSVRRAVAALLPGLLGGAWAAVGLLTAYGPAAPAAAATPCVGVVVDGRLAGGTLRTACAQGDPRTGLDALTRAGFGYAFVPRQPGLVCQVDGFPECARTSTRTYWSYWHRARGSSRWVYSTQGAGSYDPEPGSTEAWVWQDGGRRQPPSTSFRSICPQAATSSGTGGAQPAPATRSDEPVDPPATGKPQPVNGGGPSRTARPPTPSASASRSPAGTAPTTAPPSPTRAPSSTAAPPPTPSPTASGQTVQPPADSGDDGPPWVGLAVGAALVAALGGAAVLRARRGGTP